MVRDVRGLKVVHEQYEKLEHVVDNLNEKTRGLLLRERREFLAAYRAHTYKIQNELRELRRRVAEEQSSQQKDEKVKQLKEDCDWFRQEALEPLQRAEVRGRPRRRGRRQGVVLVPRGVVVGRGLFLVGVDFFKVVVRQVDPGRHAARRDGRRHGDKALGRGGRRRDHRRRMRSPDVSFGTSALLSGDELRTV